MPLNPSPLRAQLLQGDAASGSIYDGHENRAKWFTIPPVWDYYGQPYGPLAARPRFPTTPPVPGPQFVGRCSMTVAAIVMWSVWAAFALYLAVLFIYRSSLARDEEDQIFLDESFDHEKAHQAVIAARVAKVEPLVRMARDRLLRPGRSVAAAHHAVRRSCMPGPDWPRQSPTGRDRA